MRFLLGLLLVLVLVPSGGFFAPCCEASPSEDCCPLDRDCAAAEGLCPVAARTVAVATDSFVAAPPVDVPSYRTALPAAPDDLAPPPRAVRASIRLPLLN